MLNPKGVSPPRGFKKFLKPEPQRGRPTQNVRPTRGKPLKIQKTKREGPQKKGKNLGPQGGPPPGGTPLWGGRREKRPQFSPFQSGRDSALWGFSRSSFPLAFFKIWGKKSKKIFPINGFFPNLNAKNNQIFPGNFFLFNVTIF